MSFDDLGIRRDVWAPENVGYRWALKHAARGLDRHGLADARSGATRQAIEIAAAAVAGKELFGGKSTSELSASRTLATLDIEAIRSAGAGQAARIYLRWVGKRATALLAWNTEPGETTVRPARPSDRPARPPEPDLLRLEALLGVRSVAKRLVLRITAPTQGTLVGFAQNFTVRSEHGDLSADQQGSVGSYRNFQFTSAHCTRLLAGAVLVSGAKHTTIEQRRPDSPTGRGSVPKLPLR